MKQFDSLNNAFLEDIGSGKLRVASISKTEFLRARDLIRYAGVVKKRNLKSGDAMVATSALALSIEQRERVTFYTSDWTLYDILRSINAFTSRLDLVLLGTPKAP